MEANDDPSGGEENGLKSPLNEVEPNIFLLSHNVGLKQANGITITKAYCELFIFLSDHCLPLFKMSSQ